MSKKFRDDIDQYFDYGLFASKRLLYIGSNSSNSQEEESGTDYKMAENAIIGLSYLNTVSDKPITIMMNNLGGEEYHGYAIYDAVSACRCHVTIIGIGYCSSMGSIILQAADLRVLAKNSFFMIHDGSESLNGHCKNVENYAKLAEKNRERMYRIYYEKMKEKVPKITIKAVEKLCTLDKVYSAEEAVDCGLADEVLDKMNKFILD